ncbi:MAG: hypothetical protein ACFFA3_03480 [Promethearchaeota archaeon]
MTLDLKKARQILSQAQYLAEKFKLNRLAVIISNEHDELLKQLSIWDNLKDLKASIDQLLEMVHINDYMENMLKKHAVHTPNVESEIPVLLLIISEGGLPLFSKTFTQGLTIEEDIIGSFLTAFNLFSNEIFSEGLDRAKFGEYTIIMSRINSFSVCYLFKGQSYLAKQKLRHFIRELSNIDSIWQTLNNFYKTHEEIQLTNYPLLEDLLNKTFL